MIEARLFDPLKVFFSSVSAVGDQHRFCEPGVALAERLAVRPTERTRRHYVRAGGSDVALTLW